MHRRSSKEAAPSANSKSETTILFTCVMSSGPAVAVLAPIFLNLGSLAGIGVVPAGFVTALASAFAFVAPTGSPAERIVYGSGFLRLTDIRRAGAQLSLVSLALLILVALLWWPLLGPRSAP